mgnify:CR=1 FL=1
MILLKMNWFLLALSAPILWSIVNHVDKYLLSKFFRSGGVGALMLYSSVVAIVVLPVFYFFSPDLFLISDFAKGILILAGFINALFILFYLFAINEDDASVVMPFFLTIPIFGYLQSWILIGETLTLRQIVASLIILFGSLILSFKITSSGYRFRGRMMFFVLISSFFFALYETLFKFAAVEVNFWTAVFWEHLGLFLVGFFLFVFIERYRREFLGMIKENSTAIFSLNLTSEITTIVGNIATAGALVLAPVALVQTVSSLQPLFVFIFGALITLYLPKIGQEDLSRATIIQKVLALAIILVGTYLLFNA